MIKITGRFHTAATFSASWKSPSLVAPSPVKTNVACFFLFSTSAKAIPSASASCGPRCDIIPKILYCCVPKWNERSRPLVNPEGLPCHCAIKRESGISRVVKTPRLRCIGKIYSSVFKAKVQPTAIASCPMPENHLPMRPCRKRMSIFSSISRGSNNFL